MWYHGYEIDYAKVMDCEIYSTFSHTDLSEHAVGGPPFIVSLYALMFAIWI
jgi:hypothetical protein